MPNLYTRNKKVFTEKKTDKFTELFFKVKQSLQNQDNHTSYLVAGIVILLLLIIALVFWQRDHNLSKASVSSGNNTITHVPNGSDNGRSMGIVTFFHTSPLIGQLKVFSDWEGKYRVKEQGSKVSFDYIGDRTGIEPEIFSIQSFSSKEWAKIKETSGSREIKIKDDAVFVLHKGGVGELKGKAAEEFQSMSKDVDGMMKDFKVLKL